MKHLHGIVGACDPDARLHFQCKRSGPDKVRRKTTPARTLAQDFLAAPDSQGAEVAPLDTGMQCR